MRRPRSSRAEIVEREQQQAAVVAELVLLGADDLAAQVTHCWHDRLVGDPRQHRYRCRSCACLSCRRPPLQAWWQSFQAWCQEGGAASYIRLAVDEPLVELPAIVKSLRNFRDRLVRAESWLFEELAFCGLTDGQHLHVLVSHPGLAREQISERLHALWPEIVLADVPAGQTFELLPHMLALLGSMRRGLQPARFMVLPHQEH